MLCTVLHAVVRRVFTASRSISAGSACPGVLHRSHRAAARWHLACVHACSASVLVRSWLFCWRWGQSEPKGNCAPHGLHVCLHLHGFACLPCLPALPAPGAGYGHPSICVCLDTPLIYPLVQSHDDGAARRAACVWGGCDAQKNRRTSPFLGEFFSWVRACALRCPVRSPLLSLSLSLSAISINVGYVPICPAFIRAPRSTGQIRSDQTH